MCTVHHEVPQHTRSRDGWQMRRRGDKVGVQPHLEGTGEVDGEGGTAGVDGDGLRVGGRVHAAVEVVRGHRRHRGIAVEPLVQLRDETTDGGGNCNVKTQEDPAVLFVTLLEPENLKLPLLACAKSDPDPPESRPATPSRPRRAPANPIPRRCTPAHSPAAFPRQSRALFAQVSERKPFRGRTGKHTCRRKYFQ